MMVEVKVSTYTGASVQRLAARNLRGVSACIFQQLPDPPTNPSEATGFQLTRHSPPQHRFADPPPHLTSSLSHRSVMNVSLPSWVAGLRDMHVRLTCTGPRLSSLFPHSRAPQLRLPPLMFCYLLPLAPLTSRLLQVPRHRFLLLVSPTQSLSTLLLRNTCYPLRIPPLPLGLLRC